MKSSIDKLERELVAKYGEAQRTRLHRGMSQVASFWRAEDGDAAAFEELVQSNFAGDQATLDTMFDRFEHNLEKLNGHMGEIGREFRNQSDLDVGPILGFDEVFAGYDPSAHINDDFFRNKLAFIVLLNFPLDHSGTAIDGRREVVATRMGRSRLAQTILKAHPCRREPGVVRRRRQKLVVTSPSTTFGCIIWLTLTAIACFPPKLRLLSHWNLRDEIKADYSDAQNGLAKQRMIQQVMERIVTQTIPGGGR